MLVGNTCLHVSGLDGTDVLQVLCYSSFELCPAGSLLCESPFLVCDFPSFLPGVFLRYPDNAQNYMGRGSSGPLSCLHPFTAIQ